MPELLIALSTGIIAGIAHVYMGADHLAALMPLTVGRKLKAAWMGVRWGIGHSMGVIIVAIIFLVVRKAVNIDPLSEWGERIVGVMLIGLGIIGIRAAFKHKLHAHMHDHGEGDHTHLHVHVGEGHPPELTPEGHSHFHSHAAFAAGTLHGVAGMAHLMGVLPSLAFPTLKESFSYLGGFAAGTVAGMAFFAAVFGTITAKLGQKAPKMIKGSMYAAGVICIVVGIAWIVVPLLGGKLP